MLQTTYTVIRPSGSIEADGLDLIAAVQCYLAYDGYEYELRDAGDEAAEGADDPQTRCFKLFVSRMSRNSSGGNGGMIRATTPGVRSRTEDEAWPTIAAEVLKIHRRWGGCEIISAAEYAALQAEIARDAE